MKILSAALGVLLCLGGVAHASDGQVILAGGERGKTYQDVYAVNLGGLLKQYHVKYRTTAGSEENLELLASKAADIGFAQADLYAARLRNEPQRFGGLTVLGRLADECLFMAYRKKGPISEWGDLKREIEKRQPTIAVGPPEGGTSGTWRFMTTLEPNLARLKVDPTGGTLALNQLGLGMLDLVAWVTDPSNRDHKMLLGVLANEELALLPVDDPALEYTLAGGTRIYAVRPVEVDVLPLRTICTSALVLARPEAPPRLVEAVSDLLSLRRDDLLRTDPAKSTPRERAFPTGR
jgi:hypothetical protein